MIKNERQYKITKAQADRFSQTLELLEMDSGDGGNVHPLIAKARRDAVRSQLADLEKELAEYDALKKGEFRLEGLNVVAGLPDVLIKARIAQGLTQRELAERMGLKEQQIQKYEASDYASASFARIREVADALYRTEQAAEGE